MKSEEGLLRAIGPVGLALSVVNVTVGGSIFVLPAVLARQLGTAAPTAYLAGAAVMTLVALAFAEAGRRTTVSGGPYAYVERAFGQFPGYLAGLLTWLATIVACGAVGAALVDSLATMVPSLHQPVPRALGVAAVFGLLALVNVRGVRAGTALASAAGVAKFVGLLLFVLLAARFVQRDHLAWTLPARGSGLGRSTVLVIFALAGMEIPLCAGGEIREPGRTVPRALAAATILIVLLYVTVHLIAQGVLGPALGGSSAPLADALAGLGGPGRGLILAVGAISMVGFLGGDILGQSRVLFAFARDGLLPRKLAAVHPTTRAPHVAVLVNASVAAGLAMSGSFTLLAPIASIAIVLLYIATCVSAYVVTRREPGRTGTLPGATALLAIPGLLWVLVQSTRQEFLAVVLALAAGAVTYAVTTRLAPAVPLRPDAG
ncbi:MAG: APC family permease [Gemmatimonadales bacterium]|jgi:APA family basic amino acid/polyamine antiporter